MVIKSTINSLSDEKKWDLSEWKAFTDDNINVISNYGIADEKLEKRGEKGENNGYQQFLLF